jgi:phage replication O-like protein O
MASPQREDGHIDIANEIAEALARTNLTAYQTRILWALWRKTWGWHKKMDAIPNSQFVKVTGLYKSHVSRTITELKLRNMVTQVGNSLMFQKDYTQWRELPNGVTPYRNQPVKKLPNRVTLPNGVTGVTQPGNKKLPSGADSKETTKETLKRKVPPLYTPPFEAFWKAYPNKRSGKANAYKSWNLALKKYGPGDGLIERILISLEQHIKSQQWADPQYIPHATTWLNQARWEAEFEDGPLISPALRQTLTAGQKWLERKEHGTREISGTHEPVGRGLPEPSE